MPGDLFFALIAGDVLYLKADEGTRDARAKAGARPFQPFPDRPKGKGSMQYYSVPAAILEDAEALLAWAKESVAIAAQSLRLITPRPLCFAASTRPTNACSRGDEFPFFQIKLNGS